jgi:uncharacterized protein (TIGR02186 family)
MTKRLACLLLGALFYLLPFAASADDGLVAEMATDHVNITSQFTGEDILIFGAVSRPGDVIIKVQSPAQDVVLSRKVKFGPIWLDSGKLVVRGTPGLVYLLTSKPVAELLSPADADRYGLRLEDALAGARLEGQEKGMTDWRQAFLRLKRRKNYYLQADHAVKLESKRLFVTSLDLPAKLPLGIYNLDIYLVRNGKVVSHETHQIDVRQVRLERWVSNVAHSHAWLFGGAFTLLALLVGLGLGIVLRRDRDA